MPRNPAAKGDGRVDGAGTIATGGRGAEVQTSVVVWLCSDAVVQCYKIA